MEIRKEIECKLNLDKETKGYFKCLRMLLTDLENLGNEKVNELFDKYHVSFVDIDEIPRVGLSLPHDG